MTPHVTESRATMSVPRDGFLDALRAIALGRVIVWHTFAAPVISWFVATMPMMFFIAGTLLHGSLERRPIRAVLPRRLKRLLIPFWFFGGVVLTFVSAVHLRSVSQLTAIRPGQLVAWIVPLTDPTASAWEAGWASSPLWYLRAYLWILLLAPVLMAAWRRFGMLSLAAPFVVMMAAQVMADRVAAGAHDPIWIVGDLGIYCFFVLLGFAHAEGLFDSLSSRDLGEWILVGSAAAAVAWRSFPSADGIVNHSYPALWAIGIAWLAFFLWLRPWLSQVAQVPMLGAIVHWVTRRAMSIYLWHSPAIVGAYLLLGAGSGANPLLVLAATLALTVVASTLTGWIEDLAGGRPAELWPRASGTPLMLGAVLDRLVSHGRRVVSLSCATGAAMAVITAALLVPTGSPALASGSGGIGLPPAPSGRPDPNAGSPVTSPTPLDVADGGETLGGVLENWRARTGVAGVRLGVMTTDGQRIVLTSGTDAGGAQLDPVAAVPVTSITKTMTAALVLQLVEEGRLALDAPLPELAAAPRFDHEQSLTVRALLNHSSGLAPYQESIGYDPAAPLDPVTAVEMAGSTPLQWSPGAVGGYSNSGYLTLGLLIEQATGTPFETLLDERIIGPLGLTSTRLDDSRTAGWVGGAAGGAVSNIDDLLTWADALYRRGTVLSSGALAAMLAVDPNLDSGLGAFPVCPCSTLEDGTVAYTSIGHNGGSVTLQYSPGDDIVMVATFTESFWTARLSQQDVYQLLAEVRAVVGQ